MTDVLRQTKGKLAYLLSIVQVSARLKYPRRKGPRTGILKYLSVSYKEKLVKLVLFQTLRKMI